VSWGRDLKFALGSDSEGLQPELLWCGGRKIEAMKSGGEGQSHAGTGVAYHTQAHVCSVCTHMCNLCFPWRFFSAGYDSLHSPRVFLRDKIMRQHKIQVTLKTAVM
jgi:hypothetical protein